MNEDAFMISNDSGVWAVADGMGGHSQGDFASQYIVEQLASLQLPRRPSEKLDAIEDTLIEINSKLFSMSINAAEPVIVGSTVVVMVLIYPYAMFLWAGDSRAYLSRGDNLTQVTRDHSEVQEMVDRGVLDPKEMEAHPKANVVTRAIGGSKTLLLDWCLVEVASGDRFLICSDGLNKELRDREVGELLFHNTAEECVQSLIEAALNGHGRDNVTAIIVDIPG